MTPSEPELDRLIALLALEALPRTGWLQAGLRDVESIAAHSHGVSTLALLLAPSVEPELDVDRCVALCVVHDAPEALIGDVPRAAGELLPEGAKAAAERGAAGRLLGRRGDPARERFEEYAAGATREARFARLADKLHLGLRALTYARAGARDLERFRDGLTHLDCSEFAPLENLREAILARWD